MPSSKSPLLKAIRKAFVLSEINKQPNSPGIVELQDSIKSENHKGFHEYCREICTSVSG